MKFPLPLALSLFLAAPPAFAVDQGDILHAVFAAFQEPGVFSTEYIEEQKALLEIAARDGNTIARIVVNRDGFDVDTRLPGKNKGRLASN